MKEIPFYIAEAAARRIVGATGERQDALRAVARGRPLDAEHDHERKIRHIERFAGVGREMAEALAHYTPPGELGLTGDLLRRVESVIGRTNDFLGVAFLELGRAAANAVCRLSFDGGQPHGTGFLVSDRLLLTNHHVIPTPQASAEMVAEFNYELDLQHKLRPVTRFRLDPAAFFATSGETDLDYTLIALGPRVGGNGTAAQFGACRLTDADDKHVLGAFVNVIQHPDGDAKQVVVRENLLVTRGDSVLQYRADTNDRASGSPVFNDAWEVVALHHYSGPFRLKMLADHTPVPQDVNEGIRISAIVGDLRAQAAKLDPAMRGLLASALPPGGGGAAPLPGEVFREDAPSVSNVSMNGGNVATVTVPLQLSVRLG